jgi:rhodanese-related sulfurtransferase
MRQTIDDLLIEARRELRRVGPDDARAAQHEGAVLVDIRPLEQRRREGDVPGAVVIGRNVLEWRLCPSSPDRLPDAPGYDDRVIVMCSQGYASSLAAATLRDLGFTNATDVDGGVTAWAAAGLPLEPCHGATDEESHGRP